MGAREQAPVFILGLHRSGTTLLYQMMVASRGFAPLTTAHVLGFDALRRGEPLELIRRQTEAQLAALPMRTRGLDAVLLGSDTPEEYGFILDNYGSGFALSRENLPLFEEVRRVTRLGAGADRTLLFKNPWDLGRCHLLARMFPGARFVFNHRHPLTTASSMIRIALAAAQRPNGYVALLSRRYRSFINSHLQLRMARWVCDHRPHLVARWLVRSMGRATRKYLHGRAQMPAGTAVDVHYEDLLSAPNATMQRVLGELGVCPPPVDFAAMIAPHAGGVHPEIEQLRPLVERKLARYAASAGYDLTSAPEVSRIRASGRLAG